MNANESSRKSGRAGNAAAKVRYPANRASVLGAGHGQDSNRNRSHLPPKWEKHLRRLKALRAYFEAERRDHVLAASQPLETFSLSMADAATDQFDHDLALSQLSAEQDALFEIDEALSRIANGTYGVCEVTGKPIPEARLNALPWTRFRGEVERELERAGKAHHVRLGQLRSLTGSVAGDLAEAEAGEEVPGSLPCDETLSRISVLPGAPSRGENRPGNQHFSNRAFLTEEKKKTN